MSLGSVSDGENINFEVSMRGSSDQSHPGNLVRYELGIAAKKARLGADKLQSFYQLL